MQGSNSLVTYHSDVVIKEIRSDEMDEPLEVAAAREVYVMNKARFGYPYIPKFYSLEGLKIKMERVMGITLGQYILRYPQAEIYVQIVEMVKVAARKIINAGVAHYDMTYENIIISDDGRLWVIDFGDAEVLCKTVDRNKIYREMVETFIDTFNDWLSTKGVGDIIREVMW